MRKSKNQKTKSPTRASQHRQKQPLIEHIFELRRRIFLIALSVGVGSLAAYGVQQKVVAVLLRPAHGQHFIYTSPLGGINFLFGVCLDIGVALSLPVIVYQFLRFLEPLMKATTTRFILIGSVVSGLVAAGGITFGYFIGLPAALNFLLHQFTSAQIKPLLTIQAYLSFVAVYLLGSALMFQLPLLLIFINRIKPLKPSGLLRYERHVIVAAFVIGFIMNPTVNMVDQMLVVAPIILMYQLGIIMIWLINRRSAPVAVLFEHDEESRADRLRLASQLKPITVQTSSIVTPSPSTTRAPTPVIARVRPRTYIDDFIRPSPAALPVAHSDRPAA